MKQKGFTLIELLVVISIIGLLASIILVSLNSARAKARDAKRQADIKQIRSALEFYYDKYKTYPDTNGGEWFDNGTVAGSASTPPDTDHWIIGLANEFMAKVPRDPSGTHPYEFYGDASSYCIWAYFETVPANTWWDAKRYWSVNNAFCIGR